MAGPVSSRGLPWLQSDSPLVLCSHQEGLWAKPLHPESGHSSISQGKSLPTLLPPSSDLCRVLEEEPFLPAWLPPIHTPPELIWGLSHRKVSLSFSFLSPRTSSPQGPLHCRPPSGGVAFEPGSARLPISPQQKIPHVSWAVSAEPSLSQPGCEAAWQQLEGEPERANLGAGPLPVIPAGPRAGGSEPSPHRLTVSGWDSARAPRGWTDPWLAASQLHLNPSCPVPEGSMRRGPEALHLALLRASRDHRLHLPQKTLEPKLWGWGVDAAPDLGFPLEARATAAHTAGEAENPSLP